MGGQPAVPWLHQMFCFRSGLRLKVQHPSRPTTTGAALGVTADRALLFKEFKSLLKHGFRQTQLGFFLHQSLEQARGVVVIFQQAIQDPADSQLEIQELWWWLMEVLLNVCQAGSRRLATGKHSGVDADPIKVDLILRFKSEFLVPPAVGWSH